MSATPNNAGVGWGNPPLDPAPKPRQTADRGQNALQALLAFACIHEQAAKRRNAAQSSETAPWGIAKEEEFALDEVLQLVVERAVAITGADGAAIALANDDAIVCRVSSGKIAPDVGMRLDANSGFSGACLRRGEMVRCDDSETDSRVNPEACRRLGARSMVAVPLSARQRIIGLVEAFSSESFGFNDSDARSLSLLSELIVAAIRPEEEDRLAELSRKILPTLVTKTAPAVAEVKAKSPGVVSQPPAPPKIPVDEKFTPASAVAPAAAVVPIASPAPFQLHGAVPENVAVPQDSAVAQVVAPAVAPAVPVEEAAVPQTPESANAPREEPQEQKEEPVAQVKHTQREGQSWMGIAVAAVIAIALFVGLIWKSQRIGQAISANTRATAEIKAADTQLHTAAETPAQADDALSQTPPAAPGSMPEVTAIHHSSNAESSSIVIDVQDQVQYEAHSLDNPPRIYFDLHDTKLASSLANQSINVDDSLIKRVRIAQPTDGVTRVVLETKGQPDFSVSLDANPYRLTIDVHKAKANPTITPPPGTATKPSPAIEVKPKKTSSEAQPAAGSFQIVLDAGHGGWDLGTVGKRGLLEKDLVLDVVHRLGTLLESKLGAQVIYTRQDDAYLPLEKRAEIANLAKADLFLSVHANYSDLPTARGVETYYSRTYSSIKARTDSVPTLQNVNWSSVVDIRAKMMDSKLLASDIQQALYGGLMARNPEIRNRGVKEAQYVVLVGTQMPAVLAEISFVSSPADENKLQNGEYRQLIAEALYRGVARYHNEMKVAVAKK